MKKVLQHGIKPRWKIECAYGCVFTYDDSDIYYNLTTDIVQCPECKRNLEHKQNNKTKYEKEFTPLDVYRAKEICDKGDCDDCEYLDGDCCRLIWEEKEKK